MKSLNCAFFEISILDVMRQKFSSEAFSISTISALPEILARQMVNNSNADASASIIAKASDIKVLDFRRGKFRFVTEIGRKAT